MLNKFSIYRWKILFSHSPQKMLLCGVMQVSLFNGFADKNPKPITIHEVVEIIRADQRLQVLTENHRRYRAAGDTSRANAEKEHMPCNSVAVLFSGGKQQKHIVAFTGLSLVDIDHVPAERMAEVLTLVKSDPHTLLAYTTISGQGLRILFRYQMDEKDSLRDDVMLSNAKHLAQCHENRFLSENNCEILRNAQDDKLDVRLGAEQYKQAFAEGNKYYEDLVSLPTDGQCKNATRISGMAHDPDAYYNPDAVPFVIKEGKKPVGRPKGGKSEKGRVKSCIAAVLRELKQRGVVYAPGSHNKYISDACYMMNRYGVSLDDCTGWALDEFSDYQAKGNDVAAIVRSCYQRTDEHGTAKLPRSAKSDSSIGDVRDIRDYLTTHEVKTRYNVITRKYEIYNEDTAIWCEKTDRMESTLYCRITEEIGKRILKSDLHQLLGSEFSPEYNPFVDYLTALPPLREDDDTDYIDLVASMVHVSAADDAKHRRWFKKWFVAMVASWLDPEVTNHVILAYIGRQGIYKSTFMRRLLPPVLSSYFSVRNYASRMDKDDRLMLAEKGLVALEEIDSLTPRELNQLKAIVTAETIDERDAYSANRESRVHIASFCATGNNRRFLTDLTGNRRWLPFYVIDIDSPYSHTIDYEHLYAQAYALYREGFRYWFEANEVAELDRHNSSFEEPNMVQELIETYLRRPNENEVGEFYTSANILTAITAYCGGRVSIRPREIYMWMNRLGYAQCRAGNLRGWNVIVLTGNDIHDNHRLNAHRSRPDNE